MMAVTVYSHAHMFKTISINISDCLWIWLSHNDCELTSVILWKSRVGRSVSRLRFFPHRRSCSTHGCEWHLGILFRQGDSGTEPVPITQGVDPDVKPEDMCSSNDKLRDCRASYLRRPGDLSSQGALKHEEAWERRLAAEEGRGTGEHGGVCKSEVVSLPLSMLKGEGATGTPLAMVQPLPPAHTPGMWPVILKSRWKRLHDATGRIFPRPCTSSWSEEPAKPGFLLSRQAMQPLPLLFNSVTGMGRHTRAPSTWGDVDMTPAPVGGLSAGTDSERQCFFLGGASRVPWPASQTGRLNNVRFLVYRWVAKEADGLELCLWSTLEPGATGPDPCRWVWGHVGEAPTACLSLLVCWSLPSPSRDSQTFLPVETSQTQNFTAVT